MKRWLMVSLLMVLPMAAQEPKKEENPSKVPVQKLFILKYADPGQIRPLLMIFTGQIQINSDLHALTVGTYSDNMPAIEDAIRRLDVPAAAPQNIDLTAYYLIATDSEGAPGGALPKELDPVVTQLKNSFGFKLYRLMDTLALRTRSGQSADTSSSPGAPASDAPATVDQFHIQSATIGADGSTVRLDKMKAGVRLAQQTRSSSPEGKSILEYHFIDLGLNADVDIKEGQKVVVGRMSINKDQALFLVLTARVVN